MDTTNGQLLSHVVLFVGNITGSPNVKSRAENKRYIFDPPPPLSGQTTASWKGAVVGEIPKPIFCLEFRKNMFSPQGWVFGRSEDQEICDFQLAVGRESTISERHILFDVAPDTCNPRINNIATKNFFRVHLGEEKEDLGPGDSLEILSDAKIVLGHIEMTVWRPRLTNDEENEYRLLVNEHSKDVLDGVRVPAVSSSSGTSTYNLRIGQSGSMYQQIDSREKHSGAYATVSRVEEVQSGVVYAAKVLHFRLNDHAMTVRTRREAIQKEYETLRKLEHPNIVEAIELVESPNWQDPPWLIMEWLEYDLATAVIDKRDRVMLATEINRGLSFMHSQDCAHRDIKPGNILVSLNGKRLETVKLADFGTAKFKSSTNMKTYVGTSIYMAPEMWNDRCEYTPIVDMWSFGIMLLEVMLPGRLAAKAWKSSMPPSQKHYQEWIEKEVQPQLRAAPPMEQAILEKLLQKMPEKRWTASRMEEWLDIQTTVESTMSKTNQEIPQERGKSDNVEDQSKNQTFSPLSTICLDDFIESVETGKTVK